MGFVSLMMGILIACGLIAAVAFDIAGWQKNFFWKFTCYISIDWFVMSAVKYVLGYHNENLIESFWNVQARTLVHYGIPLLVISVVVPFILRRIFRERYMQVIRFFDSSFFFSLSFTFFLVRKMNNGAFCVAFLIGFALTVLAVISGRADGIYTDRKTLGSRIKEAVPFVLYYLVTVVIYTPNELYLNNAFDFPLSYWYFFVKLLWGGIIVSTVLIVGILLYLDKAQQHIYITLMFVLLTIGYVQGLFLNGNMAVLDGTAGNTWSGIKIGFNLALWIAMTVLIFIIHAKVRWGGIYGLMKTVAIWIILIQLVSLGVMQITSKDTADRSSMELTTDGMLDVNDKNNILFFVLDKFDGQYMDALLENSPDFLAPLNDFTYYLNTTSEFCPTGNSIPFLLTGVEFDEDSSESYQEYAYREENLIRKMYGVGYEIDVYTYKGFVSENMSDIVSNYESDIQRKCSTENLFELMTQCSRYKMSPFILKNYYQYDTTDIARMAADDRIVNIEDDLPFYRRLTTQGLNVRHDNCAGKFKFFHMHGAHPPYTMTEDFQYLEFGTQHDWHMEYGESQQKGALKIVYEYISQLKEIGAYDDSMIVITADHGETSSLIDSDGNMIGVSCPILFIKNPGETHENMIYSNAPVCHADLVSFIQNYVENGTIKTALNDENDAKIRYMKSMTGAFSFNKYEINGDVRDMGSWRLLYTKKN